MKHSSRKDKTKIHIYVSIGAGMPKSQMPSNLMWHPIDLIKLLISIATDTQNPHDVMENISESDTMFTPTCINKAHSRYFRFNAQSDILSAILLDAFEKPGWFGPVIVSWLLIT